VSVVAHVVLFRPRVELTQNERIALADSFSRALGEIPGIRRASVGRRVTHGRPYEQLMRENYEFAAVLEFDDVAALTSYLQHPAHEDLGERFFASFDAALIYDYVMTDSRQGLKALV
jgi:Stress responsive A/B Barrel Domain